MDTRAHTQAQQLLGSSAFRQAREQLVKVIGDASAQVRDLRPSSPELREQYANAIQSFVKDRGRELYFPFLSAGIGAGPYTELADGSVKLDMITGIGINFFGHSHPALISEMVDALSADVMQGNLQPGHEAATLLHELVKRAEKNSRLKHAWLLCSGTMSNEIALKIIRQKKAPATKILAFRDCFAGRSTAMQEITDNPKYREGQPLYGEALYLSFYDAKLGLEASINRTLAEMKDHLERYAGKFAAIMMEPIQGEGGFNAAPREWYVAVFERARQAGLAVWLDEIQTFGRTGEFFAFQKFGLGEYVDVVTVGKMLHACAVIYTSEYNPKPGLVAGTFSGSTVALRTARRVLELLDDGLVGPTGRIEQLSQQFASRLTKLSEGSCKGNVSEIRAIGGMIGFQPFGGTMDDVKAVLMKLFDLGVVAFFCGHGPYLIRMLPPLGAMTESDIDRVCGLIEQAMTQVAAERKAKAQ